MTRVEGRYVRWVDYRFRPGGKLTFDSIYGIYTMVIPFRIRVCRWSGAIIQLVHGTCHCAIVYNWTP